MTRAEHDTAGTDPAGAAALARLQQDHAQLVQDKVELQARLEDALARVKQLQFSVTHDLRAPLRHIGAFAQVIQEDHGAQLSAEVLSHLRTIQEAAQKMSGLLDSHLKA